MARNIIVKGGTGSGKSNPIRMDLVNETARLNAKFPIKPGAALFRRLPQEVVSKAIRDEGPEVMTESAEPFWKETCDRAFPQTLPRRDGESKVFGGIGEGHCRCALNPTGKKRIA